MPVSCSICHKTFLNQSSANRHRLNVHKQARKPTSYDENALKNYTMKCRECSTSNVFRTADDLIQHLTAEHSMVFEVLEKIFCNVETFEKWKEVMEAAEVVNYVVKGNSPNSTYYYCNRSPGSRTPRDDQQPHLRQLKVQGSCLMPSSCTSSLVVTTRQDGTVKVVWKKTHYGHDRELRHLRLSKTDRKRVASKIVNGVSKMRILDTTREGIINGHLKRLDLLTRKDIDNVKRSYKIDSGDGKRHADDAKSVDLWVQECSTEVNNPVLYYKRQGDESAHFKTEDFCLVIMTGAQQLMLQSFGTNVVSIDGTHGLNGYDFELTTLMVLDEYHEGFPVAFMFCNKKNTAAYSHFFEMIKCKVGLIHSRTFMSDMDNSFYNAWVAVMDEPDHVLYCAWHVNRAWEVNLSKIACEEKRKKVYETLKVLQQDTALPDFESSLINFISFCKEDISTVKFGEYFETNYASNVKKWAYCFREGCGLNTNMHLEAMHKTIKYFYLDRKSVRRLDKGLHEVMRYLKDKTVERIIKMTKGKHTLATRANFMSHNRALQSNYEVSENHNEGTLTLRSFNKDQFYTVRKVKSLVCCKNMCSICKICVHNYTCTCKTKPDVICKHVHYIHLALGSSNTSLAPGSSNAILAPGSSGDSVKAYDTPLEKTPSFISDNLTPSAIKTQTFEKLKTICGTLQATDFTAMDDAVVAEIAHHLQIASNLLNLTPSANSFEASSCAEHGSKELHHKIIRPQLRFRSTKKKTKKERKRLVRPSENDAQAYKDMLSGKACLFVSSSSSHDHEYL